MLSILNTSKVTEIDSVYNNAPKIWDFKNAYHDQTKKFLYELEPHLKDSWKYSYDRIQNFQFKRIQKIVEEAYNNVPFYHKLYSDIGFRPEDLKSWDDFEKLPIISKKELSSVPVNDIINSKYIHALRENAEGRNMFNYPLIYNTSGSSGSQLIFSISPFRILFNTLMGYRQMDFQSNGKYKHIQEYSLHIEGCYWWINIDEYQRFNMFTIYIPEKPKKYFTADRLHEYLSNNNIKFISTYPSVLQKIIDLVDLSKYSLKLITVHSEKSSQSQRNYFAKITNTPVVDEYSSQELTRIALQCPNTKEYVIEEDHNYIENKNSKIIGTSLINDSTPFIRYDQDDFGDIKTSNNFNFRILKNFYGREYDNLILPDGSYVYSGELIDQIYRWRETIRIRSCTIVQTSPKKIKIYVDTFNPLKRKEKLDIIADLKSFTLAQMHIDLIEEKYSRDSGDKNSSIIRKPF